MSRKTENERILALEINQCQMSEDIKEIKVEVKELNTKFDMIIEKMEKRFASKRTEWVVKWIIWIILVTVFGSILSTIIK